MSRSDNHCKESGITLIEVMIALVISVLISMGSAQMWAKYQKSLNSKKIDKDSKNEATELISLVKRNWDYRLRTATAGVPNDVGYSIHNSAGNPCPIGTDCPWLKVYLKRTPPGGASYIDEVNIRSICLDPSGTTMSGTLQPLEFGPLMKAGCLSCPKGRLPAILMTGRVLGTNNATLSAENRRLPNNSSNLNKIVMQGNLGMQICFNQAAAVPAPMSLDVRSFVFDMDNAKLKSLQKTQVLPYENFAGIHLE